MDLSKVHFCISKLYIQCNTGSCCVHATGGVNTYLSTCQFSGPCVSCLCLSLCMISNRNTSKKTCHPCQTFSKFDALLHKTQSAPAGNKVPRLDYVQLSNLFMQFIIHFRINDRETEKLKNRVTTNIK